MNPITKPDGKLKKRCRAQKTDIQLICITFPMDRKKVLRSDSLKVPVCIIKTDFHNRGRNSTKKDGTPLSNYKPSYLTRHKSAGSNQVLRTKYAYYSPSSCLSEIL